MNKKQYQYYIRTINNFMKKYELKNFGVFELALIDTKEIYNKLTKLVEDNYHFSEKEVVDLITRYNQLNKIYVKRFKEIFNRCVGYNSLESNINFYLGGVTPWTKVILSLSENELEELKINTEGMNETQACRVYSEVIKIDDKNLEELVDQCYRDY
jgi:hypothetical protein